MKKYRTGILSALLLWECGSFAVRAVEIEERIPPSIWKAELQYQVTPSYNEYLTNRRERAPLKELYLRPKQWIDQVEGDLSREEKITTLTLEYGLSESWSAQLTIPSIQRQQKSQLRIKPDAVLTPDEQTQLQSILDSFPEEEVSGIGDITLQLGGELQTTHTIFVKGGFLFELPTADTDDSLRGAHSHVIGENQTDVGFFLHFARYPREPRLSNNIRIEVKTQLEGSRRTLEGRTAKYMGGNVLDFRYNWIYELSNCFMGMELQRTQGGQSTLGGAGQNDSFYLLQLHSEIGYGSLTDFEKDGSVWPHQLKLGLSYPLLGENTPFSPMWHLLFLTYF